MANNIKGSVKYKLSYYSRNSLKKTPQEFLFSGSEADSETVLEV